MSKAAQLNCYNETFNQEILFELELACHANFNCSYTLPTVPLDPVCDGLKREARVQFICGKRRVLFDFEMVKSTIKSPL